MNQFFVKLMPFQPSHRFPAMPLCFSSTLSLFVSSDNLQSGDRFDDALGGIELSLV